MENSKCLKKPAQERENALVQGDLYGNTKVYLEQIVMWNPNHNHPAGYHHEASKASGKLWQILGPGL
jgi:hypothetical protein